MNSNQNVRNESGAVRPLEATAPPKLTNLKGRSMNDVPLTIKPAEGERRPIVFSRDGEVFATSRDIAAFFGKEHFQVLRDIRNLLLKEPNLGLRNFVAFKINDLTGESTSHYDMDRRGFTLLAMGFTGSKALNWKLTYIDAFEMMEAELRARPMPAINYADPQVLLGVMQHLQGQLSEKDQIIAKQGERLEHMDRIEGSVGSMAITDAAKTLKVGRDFLIRFMSTRSWIYKRPGNSSWLARQEKINAGYMEHKDHLYTDSLQQERVSTRALVTGKGLLKLAELLDKPLH